MDRTTFEYLTLTKEQIEKMALARESFGALSTLLDDVLPEGPDKTYVMRTLRTAAMWANVSITRQPNGSPRS